MNGLSKVTPIASGAQTFADRNTCEAPSPRRFYTCGLPKFFGAKMATLGLNQSNLVIAVGKRGVRAVPRSQHLNGLLQQVEQLSAIACLK